MKGNVKLLAGFLLLFSMASCGNSYEDEIQKKVPQLAEMADLGSVEYTVKKSLKRMILVNGTKLVTEKYCLPVQLI